MLFLSIYHLFQAYAPTNLALRWLRSRRGLKWGIPAMLLGLAYLWAAATCSVLIDRGAPGWLNLLVILFIWNALKFIATGPITLILLARARWRERRARRNGTPTQQEPDHASLRYQPQQFHVARITGLLPEFRPNPYHQELEPHVPGDTPACRGGVCAYCHEGARRSEQMRDA